MLRRVHISDFRSCHDVTIDQIGPIMALVGRNGAGKTNILRAINWAARNATISDMMHVLEWDGRETPTKVSLDVAIDHTVLRYSIAVMAQMQMLPGARDQLALTLNESLEVQAASGTWSKLLERQAGDLHLIGDGKGFKIGATAPCLPLLLSLAPTHPIAKHVRPLLSFLGKIRYYPFDEPSEVVERLDSAFIPGDAYAKWRNQYVNNADPGASVPLRLVFMLLEQQEKAEELKRLLGRDGLGLLDDIRVHTLNPDGAKQKDEQAQSQNAIYILWFAPPKPGHGPPTFYRYAQLSTGTRRVMNILTSMVFDGSSVMLMEQPEDSIHSGLMKKLIDLLRVNAEPTQFFLATHSCAVFNRLQPSDFRLVTIRNGITNLRSLSAQELRAAADFIDREGSMTEFLETVEEA
ncbi:MAG: AAA family ATPase [Planctomycetota bacterium]|nr:AAA family ATPase [Planctomycetota bacterium]